MTEPKRHHYVAEAILWNFANAEGFVQVYDRDRKSYRPQQPAKTAYIKHLYTAPGSKDAERINHEPQMAKIDGLGVLLAGQPSKQRPRPRAGW